METYRFTKFYNKNVMIIPLFNNLIFIYNEY